MKRQHTNLGQRTSSTGTAWCLLLLCATLSSACLGDAEHSNPLDSRSDRFQNVGTISGQVVDQALEAVPQARVALTPGSGGIAVTRTTRTGSDGRFAFADVPADTYVLTVTQDGYASGADTLEVVPGGRAQASFSLNGLPLLKSLALHTAHISRWYPQSDLYRLDVVADLVDPDGRPGIERVWLEIPEYQFADTLAATVVPGQFAETVAASSLPTGSLQALLGRRVLLRVRDRNGFVSSIDLPTPVRIIEQTPVAVAPQGLEVLTDPRPELRWEAAGLAFPFTYRIDVVLVESNLQIPVQSYAGIDPDATSLRLETPLEAGRDYFWTVSVVDAFGNWSRSKEAGFRVE